MYKCETVGKMNNYFRIPLQILKFLIHSFEYGLDGKLIVKQFCSERHKSVCFSSAWVCWKSWHLKASVLAAGSAQLPRRRSYQGGRARDGVYLIQRQLGGTQQATGRRDQYNPHYRTRPTKTLAVSKHSSVPAPTRKNDGSTFRATSCTGEPLRVTNPPTTIDIWLNKLFIQMHTQKNLMSKSNLKWNIRKKILQFSNKIGDISSKRFFKIRKSKKTAHYSGLKIIQN